LIGQVCMTTSQTPNRRASLKREAAFGHGQSRDPTSPRPLVIHDSTTTTTHPCSLPSPAIYYSTQHHYPYLRPSATLVYPIDRLSAAIRLVLAQHHPRRIPSRVPSTHLANTLHSPSKLLDDSQLPYTFSYPYRIAKHPPSNGASTYTMKVSSYPTRHQLYAANPPLVRPSSRLPNHHGCSQLLDDRSARHWQLRPLHNQSCRQRQEAVQGH
jgi:hypothetical protein